MNKWPSQPEPKGEMFRTIDMIDSKLSNPKDLGWEEQELLLKVSHSLMRIETQFEQLLQVLWAKDSQELL